MPVSLTNSSPIPVTNGCTPKATIRSKLGDEIGDSVSSKFRSRRDPVDYMAYFRAPSGATFAVERGTSTLVNLWLTILDAVRRAAEAEHLRFKLVAPWPRGRGGDYGRISSLKQDPDLPDAPLYRVQVRTVGEAQRVLEALA